MSATRWNKKQFSCFQVAGWEVGSSEKLGPWAYGEFPMESTYHPLYNSDSESRIVEIFGSFRICEFMDSEADEIANLWTVKQTNLRIYGQLADEIANLWTVKQTKSRIYANLCTNTRILFFFLQIKN